MTPSPPDATRPPRRSPPSARSPASCAGSTSPDGASAILEKLFAIHPLAIEGCLNERPFPKLENHDDCLCLVVHAIGHAPSGADRFTTTGLDAFLGPGYLVTFHRKPLQSVSSVIDRSVKAAVAVARGPDRLAFSPTKAGRYQRAPGARLARPQSGSLRAPRHPGEAPHHLGWLRPPPRPEAIAALKPDAFRVKRDSSRRGPKGPHCRGHPLRFAILRFG